MTSIKFIIHHNIMFGQAFYLANSSNGWLIDQNCRMNCFKQCKWELNIEIRDEAFEYKYVIGDYDTVIPGNFIWENGSNRRIQISEGTPKVIIIEDIWEKRRITLTGSNQLDDSKMAQDEIIDESKIITKKSKDAELENHQPIVYQLVHEVKQEQMCLAVAFNNDGTIMVADCDNKIAIWGLENGILKSTGKQLEGHTNLIFCLIFSKKQNWFASANWDNTIRCWKETTTNNWVNTRPLNTNMVTCLLLNKSEDQLLTCGYCKTIKVWKVNCDYNILTYDYSLVKHTKEIYCIGLNESEKSLVSCGMDKLLIIWGKQLFNNWEFKYYIAKSFDDYGLRISFMNDNIISLQQQGQGITHLFELENGVFQERSNLQIVLYKEDGIDGYCVFPSVYNKSRNILIQKYNKNVYIIKFNQDGKCKVESPLIDCDDVRNFGGLTNDGQHLIIWNLETKQIRVYRMNYE